MESKNDGEGTTRKLVVKRARKKPIFHLEHNSELKFDKMAEELHPQTVEMNTLVAQVLGSTEHPIDVELASDFLDAPKESIADISMITDFNGGMQIDKNDRDDKPLCVLSNDIISAQSMAENSLPEQDANVGKGNMIREQAKLGTSEDCATQLKCNAIQEQTGETCEYDVTIEQASEICRDFATKQQTNETCEDYVTVKQASEICQDDVRKEQTNETCQDDVRKKQPNETFQDNVRHQQTNEMHQDDVRKEQPNGTCQDDLEKKQDNEMCEDDLGKKQVHETDQDDVWKKQAYETCEDALGKEQANETCQDDVMSKKQASKTYQDDGRKEQANETCEDNVGNEQASKTCEDHVGKEQANETYQDNLPHGRGKQMSLTKNEKANNQSKFDEQQIRQRRAVTPQRLSKLKKIRAELMQVLPVKGEDTFSPEARATVRALLKREKKLTCPREGCDNRYSTMNGFEYHVLRCGVTSLNTSHLKCSYCGTEYRSKEGLAYHLKAAHGSANTTKIKPTKLGQGKSMKESPAKSKSKYSLRQRSKEDNFYAECNEEVKDINLSPEYANDEDEHDSSTSDEEDGIPVIQSESYMKYFELVESNEPDCVKMSSKFKNMSTISEEIRQNSMIKCPYARCSRTFRIAAHAYKHIKACKSKKDLYSCTLCGKTLLSRNGIRKHIILKHRKKKHDSENDEESEYSGNEIKFVKDTWRSTHKELDYVTKTKDWYKAFLSGPQLVCWQPSLKHWKRLSANEVEQYLPVTKISPVFRIQPLDTDEQTPEQYKEYQLPLFSSAPINSAGGLCNITFNVGGSVWAMDWVPMPVKEEDCDQYLAIGCHRDPQKEHLLSDCYKEKGVLQIWRFPNLQNRIRPTEQPEFCLGIAHDYGPLWDIHWCPSGAWNGKTPMDDELGRLGLLALACADGKVRIFSVPLPFSLMKSEGVETPTSPDNLIYRAVPHMVLSPGSLCRKYREECGAAWSVSWQPINGHNKVIASYADGTVAVWDLKTNNRILKGSTPDGLTEYIFPISHFQAHNAVVRSFAWCPCDPNYIATAGYDKLIKMWDLRHTSQPVMYFEQVWSYHITWPVHWGLLMYSTDSVYRARGTRRLEYYTCSDDKHVHHSTTIFVKHQAASWHNDYSVWKNVLVSVDVAGLVSMNYVTETVPKTPSKSARGIFCAFVEPLVESENIQSKSNGGEKKDQFKIVFKDVQPLSEKSKQEKLALDEPAYLHPSQPPHAAVHKVRWNPNFSSYNWLATAGKCGLVRLCYVDML